MSLLVSPSILAADPLNLEAGLRAIEKSGADWVHVDVMDGHFVPNLSFGLPLIKALKNKTQLPLDVHIMVANPDAVAAAYVQAGADYLSFHAEASRDPCALIKHIHSLGAKAGMAINPETGVELASPLLKQLDMLLVMAVTPGFGGQSLLPTVFSKLEAIGSRAKASNTLLAVDGGVNLANATKLRKFGADILVAGSAFFKADSKTAFVEALKSVRMV